MSIPIIWLLLTLFAGLTDIWALKVIILTLASSVWILTCCFDVLCFYTCMLDVDLLGQLAEEAEKAAKAVVAEVEKAAKAVDEEVKKATQAVDKEVEKA